MDDLISRQAAIKLAIDLDFEGRGLLKESKCREIVNRYNMIPSIQPEPDSEWRKKHHGEAYAQGFVDGCKSYERQSNRKVGKWNQGRCSECGYDWGKDAPIASVPNYCPNCGAPMENADNVEKEETDITEKFVNVVDTWIT